MKGLQIKPLKLILTLLLLFKRMFGVDRLDLMNVNLSGNAEPLVFGSALA